MEGRSKHKHVHFWLHHEEEKLFLILSLAGAVVSILSLFAWLYVFLAGDAASSGILRIELLANGLVLLFNLYCICRIGYNDRFWRNVGITFLLTLLVSMAALYIGKVQILAPLQAQGAELIFGIMQFLVYLTIAAVMAVIPVLLNCVLMWVIMRIFGKKKEA